MSGGKPLNFEISLLETLLLLLLSLFFCCCCLLACLFVYLFAFVQEKEKGKWPTYRNSRVASPGTDLNHHPAHPKEEYTSFTRTASITHAPFTCFHAGNSICFVQGTLSKLGGVSGNVGKMSLFNTGSL